MFDFSPAQIHLAINHLPVFGALLAATVLGVAALTRRPGIRNLGLSLLVFAAVSALPAYFSGEGTEEVIENRPGVSEALIERHEEAAGRALAVILAAGLAASAALAAFGLRRERVARILSATALVGSLASSASLAQVAHLGGQIRHDEIRSGGSGTAPKQSGQMRDVRQRRDDD